MLGSLGRKPFARLFGHLQGKCATRIVKGKNVGVIIGAGKQEMLLEPPWTNTAGSLGFSDEARRWIEFENMGAFITAPISYWPRSPARPPRAIPHHGDLLLHTGLPNTGFNAVLRAHQRRWAKLPCPTIVHLLGEDPGEMSEMVEQLEGLENIVAVEVGLGDQELDLAVDIVTAAACGELPILAHIPMHRPTEIASALVEAGASALSLAAPRGAQRTADGSLQSGRLYGPGILPHALGAILRFSQAARCPILGSGGLYAPDHAAAMFDAGASAVQLDTVLWTQPKILPAMLKEFRNMA